jgi:cysteinyl-tRNA synthetase
MRFYNTLNKKVEEFIPIEENKVKLYTCGPTVYHYAHIGNLRTYINEDILEKTLKYLGYEVNRVMNITDVGHLSSDGDTGDDKMLKGAKRENKTVLEIAEYYTNEFKKDATKLNIAWPETVVPATSMIDDYIKFIQKLEADGYAYFKGGNVYFDTSKLKEYYVLTNHTEDSLLDAVREDVEIDDNKRNKTDFVLWFTKSKFDNQELKWESPWGVGYPGWHIECSVISLKYLGEYLDIHCGGVDNIFPHHTNEIAQTECYVGHKWCNYWFHPEHLNDATGKMSKSKGEFLTVSLLEEKGYNPLAYRFMCLQSHYHKQLVFTYENLDVASNAYTKLVNKINSITVEGDLQKELFDKYNDKFKAYLSDDLNTANAVSVIYEVLKDDINGYTKIELIKSFDKVLSLDLVQDKVEEKNDNHEYIMEKINERNIAKQNKDYALADQIREELLSQGIVLKDTREGTVYEVK